MLLACVVFIVSCFGRQGMWTGDRVGGACQEWTGVEDVKGGSCVV